MTRKRSRPFPARAAAMLALLAAATAARAQYGDAYHAPDTLRLQQAASQRARQQTEEHYARLRANVRPVPVPQLNFVGSGGGSNTWAETSRITAQNAAAARQDARQREFQAKVQRLDALIRQRGIQRRVEDYDRLIAAAVDAGLDAYWARRTFGMTRSDFADRVGREQAQAMGAAFSGSTRSSCQGGCSETLHVAGGHRYTGETLNGLPHGAGTLAYANGDQLRAQWSAGRAGAPVRLQYASGDVYEGGFDGTQFSGSGRFVYRNGSVDSGPYSAGRLDGAAERLIVGSDGSREMRRGRYKAGVPVGVHESTFENSKRKLVVEDFDNPAASRAEWVDGKTFVGVMDDGMPVSGTLTYASGRSFTGLFHANGAPRAGLFKGDKGASQYGHFNDASKRHGYVAMTYGDGGAAEIMHNNDGWAGPVLRTQPNGDVITGTTTRPGFLVWGVLRAKDADAASARPAGLTEKGEVVTLPEADHAAAREAAQSAAAVIVAEREKLRKLMGV